MIQRSAIDEVFYLKHDSVQNLEVYKRKFEIKSIVRSVTTLGIEENRRTSCDNGRK